MPRDAVIGWDVGGAHLKAAAVDGAGCVRAALVLPCPLWRGLHHLEAALTAARARLDAPWHAITMTGELTDVFRDRREGVRSLVSLLVDSLPERTLFVYAGLAGFLTPESAMSCPEQVASANWLASASLAAVRLRTGLFVDIGSTTTDIVPFAEGRVCCRGYTDHARLRCEELLYTGVVRTPVAMLASRVPFDGEWVTLMAEHFATLADVHRLTGELPSQADLLPAADGGDKTVEASARRLARMIGLDLEARRFGAWQALARYLREHQLQRIQNACARVLSQDELDPEAPLVGAGVGRFLARALAQRLNRPYLDFTALFAQIADGERERAADCAPAVAVAELARTWS